jgi:hypothetical protein
VRIWNLLARIMTIHPLDWTGRVSVLCIHFENKQHELELELDTMLHVATSEEHSIRRKYFVGFCNSSLKFMSSS